MRFFGRVLQLKKAKKAESKCFPLQSGLGPLVSKDFLDTNKTDTKHIHTVCQPEWVSHKEGLQYKSLNQLSTNKKRCFQHDKIVVKTLRM
jgi:hypothetical protein